MTDNYGDYWWDQRFMDAMYEARQRGCLDCCEGTCEKPWPHEDNKEA